MIQDEQLALLLHQKIHSSFRIGLNQYAEVVRNGFIAPFEEGFSDCRRYLYSFIPFGYCSDSVLLRLNLCFGPDIFGVPVDWDLQPKFFLVWTGSGCLSAGSRSPAIA